MGDFPNNDPSIAIHHEVIPVDPAWADEERLQEFLYERYQKKNELLDEFYRTGHFPGERRGVVNVNGWTMLKAQLFWAGAYYLHYITWMRPLWQMLIASIF